MANYAYTKALEALLNGDLDLNTDTIKVVLCTAAYTAVQATDNALDDIPAGARVATQTLANVTIADGLWNADDSLFPAVAAGSTVTQIVIYKDASPEGSALLVLHIDAYTGLPFITSGSDINLAWPNDANKIGRLVSV